MAEQAKTAYLQKVGLPANTVIGMAQAAGATHLMLLAAETPIQLDLNGSGHFSEFRAGMQIEADISRIDLLSGVTQVVEFSIGIGGAKIIDTAAQIQLDNVTVDAGTTGAHAAASSDVTLNVSAVTSLVTANTGRKSVFLSAHPDNTVNIRVGETGVGAGAGLLLSPGMTLDLPVTCGLYGCNESAASGQKVSILQIT